MNGLTDDEADEWWAVLLPFHENSKATKPDVKALARWLRSDKPLNEAQRDQIAELLDSRWRDRSPMARACNWELRPAWAGWRAKRESENKREALVLKAVEAAPTITDAMDTFEGSRVIGKRTAWTIWARIRRERAWWKRILPGLRWN